MKKILSIVLLAVMILSLGLTAFADDSYTITITNSADDHEYGAYQIFAGKLLEEDGKKTLTNITWGDGLTAAGITALEDEIAAYIAAIPADETNDDILAIANPNLTPAEAYARYIALNTNNSDGAKAMAEHLAQYLNTANAKSSTQGTDNYTISGLDAGYYLVKDEVAVTGENSAITDLILQVVSDVTVAPKVVIPTVEKEIKEEDSTSTDVVKSGDYAIGDTIPYTITADLGSIISGGYKKYYVEINDTLPAGLTYTENSIKVKLDGTDKTTSFTIVTPTEGSNTIKITCNDVIALGAHDGSEIVVTYTAVLNENAEIGNDGNKNTVTLTYQNNPDWDGSGTPPTGDTPEDYSIVFTFEYIVNKVDENGDDLAGAGFTLYKKDGENWVKLKEISAESLKTETDKCTFDFRGLSDGEYKLEESDTPKGYNTMDPFTFVISHTEAEDTTTGTIQLTGLSAKSGETEIGEISSDFGTITQEIENRTGSILPSTGGIGTTIFYVIGGILLVGAGVVLVSRKRVDAQD